MAKAQGRRHATQKCCSMQFGTVQSFMQDAFKVRQDHIPTYMLMKNTNHY